ncbi:MAG: S8 family serine peptidase [Thaumarchaeota archaeon]|nr:S8 family serine peptidase [Nitrososphaerota archaeon]
MGPSAANVLPQAIGEPTSESLLNKADSDVTSQLNCQDCKQQIIVTLANMQSENTEALDKAGLEIQAVFEEKVYGIADADTIRKILQLPFVDYVSAQAEAYEMAIVSKGLPTLMADTAQAGGLSGAGVKVAIIDGGFNIQNPEIRDNVKEFRNFRADDKNEQQHGTAVAEIVIDVAPQAELYLYAVATDGQIIQAIDRAIAQKVGVISLSLGIVGIIPRDGTSALSRKLEQARSLGIVPIVAAGNDARKHWSGRFDDSDRNGWTLFSGVSERNPLRAGSGRFCAILMWNDWPATNQDFDIYLFDGESVVASSGNRQTGRQRPGEELCYTPSVGRSYAIGIKNYSATKNVNLELFVVNAELTYATAEGSIAVPADSRGAITVGAVHWDPSKRLTSVIEDYSSRGPTLDGRVKPDVTAPTCVQTTSFTFTFCGTSASAPHVAGVVALLLSGDSLLTPDDIQILLEKGAIDLGSPGKDNVFGSGTARVTTVSLETNPHNASITVDQSTFQTPTQKVLVWKPGSMHEVTANPIPVSEDARQGFKQWSTGSTDKTLRITYDGSMASFVAIYDIEYKVSVDADYGEVQGDGWYLKGSQTTLAVNPMHDHGNSTRRAFNGWTGNIVSPSDRITLTVDSPKRLTINWEKQYELIADNLYNSSFSRGWFTEGYDVVVTAQSVIMHQNSTRHLFDRLSGDVSTRDRIVSLNMNSPKRISAEWNTQYALEVSDKTFLALNGELWYDRASLVNLNLQNVVSEADGRRNLVGYYIDAGETLRTERKGSGTANILLVMESPHKITLLSIKQYILSIIGTKDFVIKGSPTSDIWFDEGSKAELFVEPLLDYGNRTRRIFQSWQSNDAVFDKNDITVDVDSPKSFRVQWKNQYQHRFSFTDKEGRLIIPERIFLLQNGKTSEIEKYETTWLDSGPFLLDGVFWNGVNIGPEYPIEFAAAAPREFMVVGRVYDFAVSVKDAVGLPVPFATVKLQLANNTTIVQAGIDGQAKFTQIPLESHIVTAESFGQSTTERIQHSERSGEIRVGFSAPVIFAIVAVIMVLAVSRRRILLRRISLT